ncbi:MAG: hypothetical protein ACKPKO_46760 [Candidatus Fonsibacter sp.]
MFILKKNRFILIIMTQNALHDILDTQPKITDYSKKKNINNFFKY